MSKISTADCKAFLAAQFSFDLKGWKRISKIKDPDGNPAREFSHPNSDETYFVIERDGVLSLADQTTESIFNKKKCARYNFCVIDPSNKSGHTVVIASRNEDQAGEHDPLVPTLFPKEWDVECELEEVFTIRVDLTEKELIAALRQMGFKSNKELNDDWDGRSR